MFYIFHGDDDYSRQETLNDLLAKMGDQAMLSLNTSRFEGTIPFADLRQACDSIPFLAKWRVVLVKNGLSTHSAKEFQEALLAYLPHLPETTRLIFLESGALPAGNKILKFAEQNKTGYVRAFTRPEGSNLEKWIRQRVEQQGNQISPRAIHLLVVNIGNDLAILNSEIEKLALYCGPGQTIEAETVNLLCPYVAEASIFDLVDALGGRNSRKAAGLLYQKLTDGTDPFYLFAMFIRQFRLLIQVKALAEVGEKPPAISKTVGIHSFVAGKLFQQAQSFSLPQLEQIYRHLLEIDIGIKTGRSEIITALNLFLAALTN